MKQYQNITGQLRFRYGDKVWFDITADSEYRWALTVVCFWDLRKLLDPETVMHNVRLNKQIIPAQLVEAVILPESNQV